MNENENGNEPKGPEPTQLQEGTDPSRPPQPGWIRTGLDFVRNAPEPPPDLIEGLLPGRGLALVTGPPGGGKTFAILEFMRAVTYGDRAFGLLHARRAKAMLIEEEHDEGHLALRLSRAGLDRRDFFLAHRSGLRLDDPKKKEMRKELGEFLKTEGIELAVFDPLANLHSRDEDKAHEMGPVIDAFQELQKASPETVLLAIHHTTKASWDGRASMKNYRGSGRLAGACDALHELTAGRRRSASSLEMTLTAHQMKDTASPGKLELRLDFSGERLVWSVEQKTAGDANEATTEQEQRDKMLGLLKTKRVFPSKGALYTAVGGSRPCAVGLLQELEDKKLVTTNKVGRSEEVRWIGEKPDVTP